MDLEHFSFAYEPNFQKISIVVGSYFLLKPYKGIGTIVKSSIDPRIVTIIGAGVAGNQAAKKLVGWLSRKSSRFIC